MIITLALQSLFLVWIACTKAASDQEWFRVTIYSLALVLAQTIICIYVLVDLTLLLSKKKGEVCSIELVVVVFILGAAFGLSLIAKVVLTMRIRIELVKNIEQYFLY